MSGKIAGITAINTSSLDNAFCQAISKKPGTICGKCYSNRNLSSFRKNCRTSYKTNGEILSSGLLEDWQIPRFSPDEIVRYDGYGELINAIHFLNYCLISAASPKVRFTLWTKRKSLVQRNISHKPSNLILIYSNSYIDKDCKLPAGFNKTFNVKTGKSSARINCSGKCIKCMKCYNPTDQTTVINQRIK
jgi:hypothetical protein